MHKTFSDMIFMTTSNQAVKHQSRVLYHLLLHKNIYMHGWHAKCSMMSNLTKKTCLVVFVAATEYEERKKKHTERFSFHLSSVFMCVCLCYVCVMLLSVDLCSFT